MKHLYLLLLLSSAACGRIGVHTLPEEDASVSDSGKTDRRINLRTGDSEVQDGGVVLDDASVLEPDSAVATDAGTDASVADASVQDSSVLAEASIVDTSLNGDWIVKLAKTGGTCADSVITYEDLWTIENESELHSLDYDLAGKNGAFSAVYVNAKVSVNVFNTNGALTGTHQLDALNMNGTVRCSVTRSVRGVRD